jgi:hypothetical protein
VRELCIVLREVAMSAMPALGQSLQIVAGRKPLYVCNTPIATKFCRAAECREGPIVLQKSLSGRLRANSRNIRLWTEDSLNQKCAWRAKFGIFFPAQMPKIFLQQYRPRTDSRTATNKQRHSITSSALTRSVLGTLRPSAFAVLRLMTNSNLVGSTTGRSDGLAPLRIRPT